LKEGWVLHDIKLACYTNPWGPIGFVKAIKDIAECGFAGVEYSAQMARDYYDRLHVFQEILNTAGLKVANLLQEIDLLEVENRDNQVDRALIAARFIAAAGASNLTICHEFVRSEPLSEEEWRDAAAVLEEIGERAKLEHGINVCYMPRNSRLVFHEKDILRLLALTDEKWVKVSFDTAEITLAGANWKKFFNDSKVYERIGIVRFHDVSASKRRAKFTTDDPTGTAPQFGRGAVDFVAICKALMERNYHGWVTLDVTGASVPPLEAVETAYRYLARHCGLGYF
jgi:sugar phosphate isomerase/epimerase